jgi:hypothetical protein
MAASTSGGPVSACAVIPVSADRTVTVKPGMLHDSIYLYGVLPAIRDYLEIVREAVEVLKASP